MRSGLFSLVAGLVLLVGCQPWPGFRVTTGIDKVPEMKATLRQHVPSGASLAEAKAFMEREGFECRMVKNEGFSEEGIDHEPLDYLYCCRTDGHGYVVRKWQVAIVVRDDAVTDILVSSGLVGP
jgi:hypothetical protein